jgi:hypothetical protein
MLHLSYLPNKVCSLCTSLSPPVAFSLLIQNIPIMLDTKFHTHTKQQAKYFNLFVCREQMGTKKVVVSVETRIL